MNRTQRLTIVVAALVAALLVPASAFAAQPTVQELESKVATANSEATRAADAVKRLDARIVAAEDQLSSAKEVVPSSASEQLSAVAAAIGSPFSRSLSERAHRISGAEKTVEELTTQLEGMRAERAKLTSQADETKRRVADAQAELAVAQKAAAEAAAQAAAEQARIAAAASIRLFVDAGHGGHDPGAVGNGVLEKDSNLAITMKVVAAGQRQGWNVGVSRWGDWFVPLDARAGSANAWGATAFVAIHANSSGPTPHGNMTISRGGQNAVLGQRIMDQIAGLTDYPDAGNVPDTRGLAVLREAHMPATLVEVLSVSAPNEAAVLANDQLQTAYAEAIVKGVADYYGIAYVPPAS